MKKVLSSVLIDEIVYPLIYIIVGYIIYKLISKLLKKSSKFVGKHSTNKSRTVVVLINNVIKYVIAIVVILMSLEVFGVDTSALIASFGVMGIVVGLALQDLIKDFVAGTFIIFDSEYNVGDIVTINGFKGEVIALGLKTTKVKSYLGEILSISNGTITEVVNHSVTDNVAIVDVDVAYEESVDKAIDVLNNLALKLNKELKNLTGEINVLGVTNLGASGVTIRVMVNTKPGEQYAIERELRRQIKNTFDKENIVIPYQQLVIHNSK